MATVDMPTFTMECSPHSIFDEPRILGPADDGAKGAQRTFCTFSPVYFKCRKHGGGMGRDCGHRLCASAGISELPRAQGAVMLNA